MEREQILSIVLKYIKLNLYIDNHLNIDLSKSLEDLGGDSSVIEVVVASSLKELLINEEYTKLLIEKNLRSINELVDILVEIKNIKIADQNGYQNSKTLISKQNNLLENIKGLDLKELVDFWITTISNEVASILGLSSYHSFDIHQGFFEMGMTSLMVIELQNRLQKILGELLYIADSIVFDYPSINSLANYLLTNISKLDNGKESPKKMTFLQSDTENSQELEAVAIIGIGCRFPGEANSPEIFWQLLKNGIDATSDIPSNRWDIDYYYDSRPQIEGKTYVRRGGFLNAIDQFDAEFFGIAPREAINLDPQHRILLEVGWEALEHAGQAPEKLMSSQTGVFIGLLNADYAKLQVQTGDPTRFNAYYGTGTTLSAAAGRLSYFLGLQGPAMVVDTACSSSLVTVHLACQSLRNGESDLALAGGCNLILSPDSSIYLSQAKAISSDGRCKTFDVTADGYSRGEGCGIVVLKRLSQAIADGDKIWAVIRGSAVNHDGHTSGFTVPNGLSQEDLLRSALDNAGIEPHQVSYIEAHGTGTPLGDPIEVRAISSVFSQGRTPEQPLRIGSVKTNIGHLESSAGIAGLIKVALALHHQEIPPHLHFKNLNPRISLELSNLEIPTKLTPWVRSTELRRAGVSSFGLSGTNAHILLEEAPENLPKADIPEIERPVHILTLSAKTEQALGETVEQYRQYLTENSDLSIADVCYTANTGRSHFSERLAVICTSTLELPTQLTTILESKLTSDSYSVNTKIAFVFSGGSLFPEIGYQLYNSQPEFRQTLERCSQILEPYFGQSFLEIIYTDLEQLPTVGKPFVSFAIEYALAQMWQSWDIQPDIVVGYGVGELVAACVAGTMTLEDSFSILEQRFTSRFISISTPRIPIISGLTKQKLTDAEIFNPEYWHQCWQNKVSDLPTVIKSGESNLWIVPNYGKSEQEKEIWLPSLKPGFEDWQTISEGLTQLYLQGQNINWQGFDQGYFRQKVILPTYSFQRKQYWLSLPTQPQSTPFFHSPSLRRLNSPLTEIIQFESQISLNTLSFLADHKVYGVIVVPATLYIAMVLAAAIEMFGETACSIEELTFLKALSLDELEICTLQLILKPEGNQKTSFQVFSLNNQEQNWQLHITGNFRVNNSENISHQDLANQIKSRCPDVNTGEKILYEAATQRGLYLGQSFQWVNSIWQQPGEAIGEIQVPLGIETNTIYPLHPGLIDACLQMLNATLPAQAWDGTAYVPVKIDYLNFVSVPDLQTSLWVHGLLKSENVADTKTLAGDIWLFDDNGQVFLEVGNLKVKQVSQNALLPQHSPEFVDWLYQLKWRLVTQFTTSKLTKQGRWIIFADQGGLGEVLANHLQQQGQQYTLIYSGQQNHQNTEQKIWLNPENRDEFEQLWQKISEDNLPLLGIIHLWSLDTKSSTEPTDQKLVCCSSLYLIQTLIKQDKFKSYKLHFITQGAQAVTSQDDIAIAQSPLWGMVRTLSYEHPEIDWQITDLLPGNLENQATSILAELANINKNEYVAYRKQERYVARLAKYESLLGSENNFQLDANATYLITGGLGDLGLAVADWMIKKGAKHLVLMSRSGRCLSDERLVRLKESDAKIVIAQADVSKLAELTKVFQEINQLLPPLRGVIHAAGILDDGVFMQQEWSRFTKVMNPKINGAWNLHTLTAKMPLDFFVLFSSAASLIGSAGQSNYAASNAFLDTLAHYRQSQGLPGLSINWGAWSDTGMAARNQRSEQRWQEEGIGQIPVQSGLEILEQFLRSSDAQIGVLPIDWQKFGKSFSNSFIPQFFTELVTDLQPINVESKQQNQIRQQLETASVDRRMSLFTEYLNNEIKNVLGLPGSHTLKLQMGLFDMGMDSLMAIELRNRLQKQLETNLPSTLLFDYPTVETLTKYIAEKVMGWTATPNIEDKKQPIINQQPQQEITDLEQFSEQEINDLLAAEMAAISELMKEAR
ncbi:SDR family NAD(P)-dependent oxidoreductase [Anabaena cylindrica UHCC 0172]|uniref:SDR family NAD(P)-dependent oxidoreductase n=1 Tax=Anabaena cylindrica TaxID=1165 RepID=UPI002B20D148|nr:SDR family NAD(P)-dependent oxidoreductase [Anabaena cylindrica]MEA5550940.1 SDR family NAD(P)-dependent oxidoreductase [Anabaena cylindrica UHCC 0172]